MKKEYKIAIITLIAILGLIIVYNVLINSGTIRNYHIKDFVIDVNIESDGSVDVKEDTVYQFNGKYNGITITIPTNISSEYYKKLTKDSMNDATTLPDNLYISKGIENVKIYTIQDGIQKTFYKKSEVKLGEAGVYVETNKNGFTTYTIYEPSDCESKRFVIEYTLKDVVVQHDDVAEFYWNFIGGEVECKIKNLKINVNANNIKAAYTHGNASGKITNTLDTVKVTYKNIKPHEFVSTRLVLDSYTNMIAKKNKVNALPLIKEVEESYSNKKELAVGLNKFAIVMTVITLMYWFFLLLKYEKEIEIVPLVINESEILTKYNPMIAACIAQNRDMHPRDILAVLIDLVNIKAIKMVHVRGVVIGGNHDTYTLTKNEEFFKNEEQAQKLDEIQESVINIFFGANQTIELTKRLKQIKNDSVAVTLLKQLDEKVTETLESIGANYVQVPKVIRIWNTIMFSLICIYILFMLGINITLNHVTLSVNSAKTFLMSIQTLGIVAFVIILLFPIIVFIIKAIVHLISSIRKSIAKLAFKMTSKKLTRMIITLSVILIIVFIFEIVVIKNSNMIIATMLFFAALLVVLTDNLMTSHDSSMRKQYVALKILQDKIENGSLLEEKQIQDNILWNRYFTLAIALGVGDVAEYVKHIPDLSSMEDIMSDFYNLTEGYYGLYSLDRQVRSQTRIKKFMSILDDMNSIYSKMAEANTSSGWSSSSSSGRSFSSGRGGFSSGGGRFSGGGGRGGGRGAF